MKKLGIFGGLGVVILLALVGPKFAHATVYVPKPGDLIRTAANPTVFLVDDGLNRIPVSAEAYKIRYNNNFYLIKIVDDGQIGKFDYTGGLSSVSADPDGALIIYVTDHPIIYRLENGFKRPFATWDAFVKAGGNTQSVRWVGTFDTYPTGAVIN